MFISELIKEQNKIVNITKHSKLNLASSNTPTVQLSSKVTSKRV